jgi:hypothetical protein
MAGWRRLLLLFLIGTLFLPACGRMRPVPAEFQPADYTPINFDQLRLDSSSLHAGDLVRVQAYFWQFLTYDPAPRYYYFNQLRYPLNWGDLEWFALYRDADMKGYYDRGVMSHAQRLEFNPQRLDHLVIYGELVPVGGHILYLQVHHLERLKID